MVSLGYTLLHCYLGYVYSPWVLLRVYMPPPCPWEATLHPPPFSLWPPGGLVGLAWISAPGARPRPGWSPILSGKGAPYKTPFLDKDDSRRPLVDEFATFLSESSNAFHRKGDKFMAALVEGPVLHERSGCAFVPQKWTQLIPILVFLPLSQRPRGKTCTGIPYHYTIPLYYQYC